MKHASTSDLPSDHEIAAMACVLKRRYGAQAGEMARSYVHEHEAVGDEVRAGVWLKVNECLDAMSAPKTLS